jgi:hypothetical protein
VNRPQRALLQQLAFRWPDLCYLVITQRGHHALVVTSMLRSKTLHRLDRGYERRTTIALKDTGLITMEVRFGDIPDYDYRHSGDTGHGWLVAITPAGREAIGAVSETQQRRAQAIATMQRCRDATRGTPKGTVDAAINELRDK